MLKATYIDGFLIMSEQVIEPVQVPFLFSEQQLQLVDLIVFLLNGRKFVIQSLLWESKQRKCQKSNYCLSGEEITLKASQPPGRSHFLLAFAAAW